MESSKSELDRRPSLKELVDIASFSEVCRSFVDLYGVGIRIFDADGARLIDLRVGNTDFCGYVFSKPPGRKRCTATVQKVKSIAWDAGAGAPNDQIASHTCFTGLRYLSMPIVYEMDLLGKIIMGPYLPDDLSGLPEELSEMGHGFDPQKALELLASVSRAPDDTLGKLLLQLGSIMNVVIYSGHKAHLTSSMHIESITAAHHDLLDRNERLQESLDKLRELDRLKSNFLATVSHELRTPLTSVIGYSEMLLEGLAGDLTDDQKEYVSTIMTKGEDLLQLIGSILDISRIESGGMSLAPVRVDLADVAKSAISTINPLATKKDLQLLTHIENDLPILEVDPDKVRQCVVNLLANAVKFTPEGGEIELKIETYSGPRRTTPPKRRDDPGWAMFESVDDRFVRISVRDNGIGIPEEQRDRIFDTFYQVDSSSTRAFGGAGLGLAIVKSYMDAHEGEVWVDSAPGNGSLFSLLLPVKSADEAPTPSLAGSI